MKVKPIVHPVQQRTGDWFKLRLGKVTGSEASKTMSFSSGRYMPTKAMLAEAEENHLLLQTPADKLEYLLEHNFLAEFCLSAGVPVPELGERKTYRESMVGERLTGLQADPEPYVSYDMKWGMINEDLAKTMYQMQNRCIVEPAGFYEHPELACGISPDGIATDMTTGEIGLVEVKCLRSANHLFKVIATQTVPDDYRDQIQLQMYIAGADWCDFIAYDSRLPQGLQIFTQRVAYDQKYVEWVLLPNIVRFLKEVDAKERYFRKLIREGKKQNETGGNQDNGHQTAALVDQKNAPRL